MLLCFFLQASYAPARPRRETVTPHPKDSQSAASPAQSGQDARFIECPPSREDPDPLGYSVVHVSGPSTNRVNLVFIGDGFTTDELGAWAAHVDLMVGQFLSDQTPPYDRYANFLNIYRIDLVSSESGVDDPANDVCVDTALDGCNCCIDWTIGLCQVDWAKTFAAINEAMPGIEVHWRLVVLNTSTFLGGAHFPAEGTLAVYPSNHVDSFYVLRHEGGHAFHLLGDEYVNPGFENNPYTGGEPGWVNLTIDPTGAKWAEWLGFSQPANGGPVGAYEGGLVTYGLGIWRPSQWSVMNSMTPLDAIGKERAIHSIYDLVDPYDDWGPRDPVVPDDALLWVEVIDPAVIVVEWFVDGELKATGPSLDLSDLQLSSERHIIEARAHDSVLDHAFSDNANPHPLDLVLRGTETLRQVVSWKTTVADSVPAVSEWGLVVMILLMITTWTLVYMRGRRAGPTPE